MLIDRVTGRSREVDICTYCTVDDGDLCIAFECADLSRPADVTWVERMHAKHADLPTDCLVLVSASGASASALAKAESYGIELLSVEDEQGWGTGVAKVFQRVFIERTTLQIARCTVTVATASGEEVNVRAFPNNLTFDESGSVVATLDEVARRLVGGPNLGSALVAMRKHMPKARWYEVGLRPGRETQTRIAECAIEGPNARADVGPHLHLRTLEGELQAICDVRVSGPIAFSVGSADMRFGRLDGCRVAWGMATIDGEQAYATYVDVEGLSANTVRD